MIKVYLNRKVSETQITIGNQYESGVNAIDFDLSELKEKWPNGNIYLLVSRKKHTWPYSIDDGEFKIEYVLTWKRGFYQMNVVVTDEKITDQLESSNTIFVSDTINAYVNENQINAKALNEQELPRELQIVYDDLITLKKNIEKDLADGKYIGPQGPKGEPGDVTEEYRNLASQIAQNASDAQASATNAQVSATNAQKALDDTKDFVNQTKTELNQIKTDTIALKDEANTSAVNAQSSATNAQVSATNAQKALDDTKDFVNQTKTELNQIKTDTSALKDEANTSAVNAKTSETKAKEYADNLKASTDDISKLKEDKVDKKTYREYLGEYTNGSFFQSNGNTYDNDNGLYVTANVDVDKIYYISGVIINESFPLIVMLNSTNEVIGTVENKGTNVVINDYEFKPPVNCSKICVNGKINKSETDVYNYPSIYVLKRKGKEMENVFQELSNKQVRVNDYRKTEFEYVKGSLVKLTGRKITIQTDNSSVDYDYAKLTYDKAKDYRFYGMCRATNLPIAVCTDNDNNIIKVFDNTISYAKGKAYDRPANTKYIYVNGYQSIISAYIEEVVDRNITSFEGNKTIVCFGDSITQGNNVYIGSDITPYKDYPTKISDLLQCNVYNAGLGGSTYSNDRTIDFKNVVDCVVSGDYSSVISGIKEHGLNQSAILQYNRLSTLNFNNVDIITIALGTNDWDFGKTIEQVQTAMQYCIEKLLTNFPHLQIYIFTPIFRFDVNNSGEDSDTYINSTSKLTLYQMCDCIVEKAKEYNLPCKDMYHTSNINKFTKDLYMGDNTHPNANGYALMAEKIGKFINGN
jgi:lysophospholipase L1-like esterase